MSTSKRKPMHDDMAVLRRAIMLEAMWERRVAKSVRHKNSDLCEYHTGRLNAYRVALRMINFQRKQP